MPIYRFNLFDDVSVPDDDGRTLDHDDAAFAYAVASLRSLAADDMRQGNLNLDDRIEIRDEAGGLVGTVTLRDAVAVKGEGQRS